MSSFDRLPDELLESVLNLAMIRKTAFDINDCLRTARCQDPLEMSPEEWKYFNPSITELDIQQLRNVYKKERTELRKLDPMSSSIWHLYFHPIESQRLHFLDWRLAGSVCRRWRRIGKIAFWVNKVIAMDLNMANELQNTSMARLSKEDQQIAVRHTISIVLVPPPLSSPACFITMPKRVAGFTSLRYLDFCFGHQKEEPTGWLVGASRNRRQPPRQFVEILMAIGVCTKNLDMGILVCPSTNWTFQEKLLRENIYPILVYWADIKSRQRKRTG